MAYIAFLLRGYSDPFLSRGIKYSIEYLQDSPRWNIPGWTNIEWNDIPRFVLKYRTPDDLFNGVDCQNDTIDHFYYVHPFGWLVYVLNDKLQDRNSQPK